ncbi:MAG: heme lyase CcmF/NrfE family subunit [Proteobacteria bacterium]|nr:heme lyase CcmF/NrfE family subunit [Pseudomonadota bacterium]
MIPELGNLSLIMALIVATILGIVPLIGAHKRYVNWMNMARPAAFIQLLFVGFSFVCLTSSFINYDFSVAYVAQNSNTSLPLMYRISAVWGGHEGSLLLWAFVLTLWTAAVATYSRDMPLTMISRVLGVMGLISIGFLAFMLFTSNPFERNIPALLEGRDLNPVLQDPGLIIHPPMLYMGYVGFSVAFAFAIAAMLEGRLDSAWAKWSRPWTTIAWVFLTMGITLGSWWAYYELGWGGWWFWDPVENASFMPWLVGTALIHSLAVAEKRSAFKAWTVLLAITAFSLSLLGTFLVRSGVLTSVHAFATDPARGLFILIFLLIVVGGSLLLYALRASQVKAQIGFSVFSRESLLLVNNVLLVVAAAMVLLGTLFPLLMDAIGAGKYSVGPPYFNAMFVPLTLPLALLVGIGAVSRWKTDDPSRFKPLAIRFAVISLLLSAICTWVLANGFNILAAAVLAISWWIVCWSIWAVWDRLRNKRNKLNAVRSVPASFWGMLMAHMGIAVFIVGINHISAYSIEKDVRLEPGETTELAAYDITFFGSKAINGPNYNGYRGDFLVSRDGQELFKLEPEKRFYPATGSPMTEAAINGSLPRDIYISLGDQLDNGAWTARLYYKSFAECIWLGGFMMALGGLLAISDRRYRRRRSVSEKSLNTSAAAATST